MSVIGMNDGKFSSSKSLKSGDEEEESRLFYIGVTRAKQGLYLSSPVTPEIQHGQGFFRPSRFVRELPSDCFEEIVVEDV